jgi:hypothetical protein
MKGADMKIKEQPFQEENTDCEHWNDEAGYCMKFNCGCQACRIYPVKELKP